MIHVLEHIPSPQEFLIALRDKLAPRGTLLIQVPDQAQNPFDLLIADHCSHFSRETLTGLLHSAGYRALKVSTDWVPKEISLIAVVGKSTPPSPADTAQMLQSAQSSVDWLNETVRVARSGLSGRHGGLFGTSIAATWLSRELESVVRFFVEEDPSRLGARHMGLPVYAPEDIPRHSHVFLALPFPLATAVSRRLRRQDVSFHLPPPA
jgi:hypothetical protein